MPRPPLADAVGYTVDVKTSLGNMGTAPADGALNVFTGKVTGVHEAAGRVCVQYAAEGQGSGSGPEQGSGEADQEWLDYFSEDIAWMLPPVTLFSRSRVPRPPLAGAAGYLVEVRAATGGLVVPGEVLSVDLATQMLRVRSIAQPQAQAQTQAQAQAQRPVEEHQSLPYLSQDIAWLDPPTAIASKSAVPRPALEDALGYSVDVKHAVVPGSAEYEVYVGVVTRVDVKARSVLVLFEGAPI